MSAAAIVKLGERVTRRYQVDQAMVNAYAEISGDRNPLHIDPAFAATTHFGRTIAHGFMTLAFVSNVMRQHFGGAWEHGGDLDVAFLAPVFPGDAVEIEVIVQDISPAGSPDARVACAVRCLVGDRVVLAGKASVDQASPAAYQQGQS